MRKNVLSVLLIALLLFAGLSVATPTQAAACLPPQLPSSFWGYAPGMPVGAQVAVSGPLGVIARTTTQAYQGKAVYSLDARAYDACQPRIPGGREGDRLTITLNGRVVGAAVWHSGTNTRLDLVQARPIWPFTR